MKSTTTPASFRGCMRMIRPIRCWYTRRDAVGARWKHTVARGEFQPSARSCAFTRTLISPRSYAARVSARRAGGVFPETASALSPAARNSCARLYACSTPAAYTIPGVEPKRSR